MKLPLSLIKSFIHIDLPVSKISETLTLLGIEVDAVLHEQPSFANVVAAEVIECFPHPNAERLQVAIVSDGEKKFQVVCGGANCRSGIKVAFAKTGAILTGSDGKPIRIESAKLRGVPSEGMLCAADELHLEGDSEGILELPSDVPLGIDLTTLLWDPVFELSLTPNLGHCFSALGVARELAAALQLQVHLPIVRLDEQKSAHSFSARVESPLCRRYMARLIENIEIAPSPFWLQRILLAAGMKPIHNAVDITNYILLKWGQPMHAFDADLIDGESLRIAETTKEEPFLCLDNVERTLPKGALVIADRHKPIAIAGIMGGANTAVSSNTKRILLECAAFDPLSTRKTAKKTGLRTESAQRFEKGVDPIACAFALDEASFWIAELSQGKVIEGAVDIKHGSFTPTQISCRIGRVNQILGLHLSLSEIDGIFKRLGFKTKIQENTIQVEVPLYRGDLLEEIDLIEEVARIYGYNNFEKGAARCITSQLFHDPIYRFENETRNQCIGLGLQEMLTADLICPKLAAIAKEFTQIHITQLKAIHSKSEEYSTLRPSLLPGLLQVAKHNFDRRNVTLHAFEIGRIHFLQGESAVELPMAALLLTGDKKPHHWSSKSTEIDFYDLKGTVENLLAGLKIPSFSFAVSQHLSFHPHRQMNILCGDAWVGSLGEVHPALLEKFDIQQRVFFAEVQLELLSSFQNPSPQMKPLAQFPSSERDWTLSLPKDALMETVFKAIESKRPLFLEHFELIDLYYPENSSVKNATFRFIYRDPLKTILFEEVESAHQVLVEGITKSLSVL